jgi:hypothetical protein
MEGYNVWNNILLLETVGKYKRKSETSLKSTAEIIENTIDVWKLEKTSVLSPKI